MNTRERNGQDQTPIRAEGRALRMAPVARAIALMLAAGGMSGAAHAQRAFSPTWFGAMGATQNTVRNTGVLPNGKPASTLTNPLAQQQQAAAQLQHSIDNLNLAARAIAAQQSAQAAARQAANDSSVPDGLADGGLKVDTNSLTAGWINAKQDPSQTVAAGKTTVKIEQTADKAILNWETFNVGRNTTVQFDQQPDWAVLNRVNDPQARPSQIQGQIKADGTVMIVNRNGVVFSGSSQVDVRSLVAAAARVTDPQFISGGLYGTGNAASFTDAGGSISVEQGALIQTHEPQSVTQGGGYVLLMGKDVRNAGQITTPQGQTELAAGDFFILRPGVGTDANQNSTTRGSEIAPQFDDGSTAGAVENAGLIQSAQGDITLAGRQVAQNGVAVSTTTVDVRGTIHLLNSATDAAGSVTLGPNATTAILLQDDGHTALNSQRDALIGQSANGSAVGPLAPFDNLSPLPDRRDLSRIEIVTGGDVAFQGGSMTLATGGQVTVSAGQVGGAGGHIRVEDGAQIDVAGAVGVSLSMDSNSVQVNIQGNELRDAPLNRDTGKLNNANVWVDTRRLAYVPAGTGGYAGDRYYTDGGLLEVGGYLDNVGHTISEWNTLGGTITLAGNALAAQRGAVFNVSGGTENVQTGYLHMSWLRGVDGNLYEVSDAPADVVYTGVYQGFQDVHPRWGDAVTGNYNSPLIAPDRSLENGYTVGRDAGTLILALPSAQFDAQIVAETFTGTRQTEARPAGAVDGYKLTQMQAPLNGGLLIQRYDPTSQVYLPVDGDVTVSDAPRPDDQPDGIWLNADALNSFQLGRLAADTTGKVLVDGALSVMPGGSIAFYGATVNIEAGLTARAGEVSLGIDSLNSSGSTSVELGKAAFIDTRGLWTNTYLDASDGSGLAYVDGGAVSLRSHGNVALDGGSWIDASAGGAVLVDGSFRGGAGGDITLAAGEPFSNTTSPDQTVTLNGSVRSFGFTHGGALTIRSSGTIIVGDKTYPADGMLPAGQLAGQDLTLNVDLTIPAGSQLPLQYTYYTNDHIAPGQTVDDPNGYDFEGNVSYDAPWTVPGDDYGNPFYYLYDQFGNWIPSGGIVQPGQSYSLSYYISPGQVVPADLFPKGVDLPPQPHVVDAGKTFDKDVTFAAGTAVPKGTVFAQTVAIAPTPGTMEFSSDLFGTGGFSKYALSGDAGLMVADGANIHVTEPVLQFTGASRFAPTGTDPAAAGVLVLPPLFSEDSSKAVLTQRAGADLELSSADLVRIGDGAEITVDPGHSVKLSSGATIDVEGSITAPGGTIIATKETTLTAPIVSASQNANPIWVGAGAILDVSGRAYTAQDQLGRTYGLVQDGGSIFLGTDGTTLDAFTRELVASSGLIVLRPGSVLDASGAPATQLSFDQDGNDLTRGTGVPVAAAGAGGTIDLSAKGASVFSAFGGNASFASGIFTDGSLRAASGGANAPGGTLSIVYEDNSTVQPSPLPILIVDVTQTRQPSVLADDVTPDTVADAVTDTVAHISVQQIEEGGFDSVSLYSRGAIAFDGNVSLSVGRSLSLRKGALITTQPGSHVDLAAPYVFLDGQSTNYSKDGPFYYFPQAIPEHSEDGVLTISADQIDIQNIVHPMFAQTRLSSSGDIRFLKTNNIGANQGQIETALLSLGDLDLTAAQVYPATDALVFVRTGYSGHVDTNFNPIFNTGGEIDIGSAGGPPPPLPASVFGQIYFNADTIRQGGVVRAPLGQLAFGYTDVYGSNADASVEFLPGSVTSISAAGLTLPYGGTVDGVNYTVDGAAPVTPNLISGAYSLTDPRAGTSGILVTGMHVAADAGALIDVSGGGTLLGAAFVQGRGGSVDTLTNPRRSGGTVYAVVPGVDVAPPAGASASAWTGATPGVGQQITIGTGVPGLPAGTYTLLPANYALMPGGFRVELDGHASSLTGATMTPDGSYVLSGYQGIAHTGFKDSLPTAVMVTPGAAVRTYSQYDEQSYDDFQIARATTFGAVRPLLPRDGKLLSIALAGLPQDAPPESAPALVFDATARFDGAADGFGGGLAIETAVRVDFPDGDPNSPVYSQTGLRLTAPGSAAMHGYDLVPVSASMLDAIGAPSLYLGGSPTISTTSPSIGYQSLDSFGSGTVVESGATLSAAQVVVANLKELEPGATITTLGKSVPMPAQPGGFLVDGAPTIASNIYLLSNGAADIGDGVTLFTDGELRFGGDMTFHGSPRIAARDLGLTSNAINIGDAGALAKASAAGVLPEGLTLNQGVLDGLLHGDPAAGIPAVQNLILTANQSVNFIGSVDLDTTDPATGKSRLGQFVIYTPAIYGQGGAGDVVNLTAETLVWGGLAYAVYDPVTSQSVWHSYLPAPTLPAGPGSGAGTFNVNANRIVLGFPGDSQPNTSLTYDRLLLGFSAVNLKASDRITATGKESLSAYQSGPNPGDAYDAATYAGSGGTLNLITPLVTGESGSVATYRTGGSLTLASGATPVPDAAAGGLGAEVDFFADSITDTTAISLHTGKLGMTAQHDLLLGDGSSIDLGGQSVAFFDVSKSTWGGDVALESAHGNIVQSANSQIDVSAPGSDAGSLEVTAIDPQAGHVSMAGTLRGAGAAGAQGGSFTVRAQAIGADPGHLSDDFAALNTTLNDGGFIQSRSFDLKQGDLAIGDEVHARQVNVSVDGGGLTVNGTIDAAGPAPGTIRLAASGDLTLAASAMLDTHGSVLQVDSYGAAIEASNRGQVELTTASGMLTLSPGARIDVSAPGVALGRIELNAPRTGETSGDIKVAATGPLTITGAQSIALNGFWRYTPTDAGGTIRQDNGGSDPINGDGVVGLDQIDHRNQLFIAAVGAPLDGRTSGLAAYGAAFHLRPGVEISSTGDLHIDGDLDLSGFRYGAQADRDPDSPGYGAGEPLSLLIRAGGNLSINGSITDGFALPPATPDDRGPVILPAGTLASDTSLSAGITLTAGTQFAQGAVLNFDLHVAGPDALLPGQAAAQDIVYQPANGAPYYFPGFEGEYPTLLAGEIDDPYSGSVYHAGDTIRTGYLGTGATIHKGTILTAQDPANAVVVLRQGAVIPGYTPIPQTLVLGIPYTIPFDFVATAPIVTPNHVYAAGETMPYGTVLPQGTRLETGAQLPFDFTVAATTFTAGIPLDVSGGYTLTAPTVLAAGAVLPAGTFINHAYISSDSRKIYPLADMQAPGTSSASIRLVGGADMAGADTRLVQPLSAVGAGGTITLDDLHLSGTGDPLFSVIRTGTGSLDLVAGGDIVETSMYGIYTAGTATLLPGGSEANDPFSVPLPQQPGAATVDEYGYGVGSYEGAIADRKTYFPDHGGDFLLAAQGDFSSAPNYYTDGQTPRYDAQDWLMRQGGDALGESTAWSINFGAYMEASIYTGTTTLGGFTGLGTLGGGNATVTIGGNAGSLVNRDGRALNVAAASTGRVTEVTKIGDAVTGGTLVQTGGGDVIVKIGGALNRADSGIGFGGDGNGAFTALRGSVSLSAGSIGYMVPTYGQAEPNDPRAQSPYDAPVLDPHGGVVVIPGDGTVVLRTRGDLVLAGTGDLTEAIPSLGYVRNDGGIAATYFSLWQSQTSTSVWSAGGNIDAFSGGIESGASDTGAAGDVGNLRETTPSFHAIALDGDIYLPGQSGIELAPSPVGQLEILAQGSIFASPGQYGGTGFRLLMSGAPAGVNDVPNPFKPVTNSPAEITLGTLGYFAFEPDSAIGDLHGDDSTPIRAYAVSGDIENLLIGERASVYSYITNTTDAYYAAAKPVQVRAGRDIIGFGDATSFDQTAPSLFLNLRDSDVSVLQAGRDIFFPHLLVAGPGTLEVTAGRNLYLGGDGEIESIGRVYGITQANNQGGASIDVLAGVGTAGPDYTRFATLYLDPANQGDRIGAGSVPATYQDLLVDWLGSHYGFSGSAADALDAFLALPTEEQEAFLMPIYQRELTLSGREYNDPDSLRFQSYLRGRTAIAALFPRGDYQGDITMGQSAASGVQTDFGGSINVAAPGGDIVVGVQNLNARGLVTQGSGDIGIYSQGSVLLGLSRIFTTFGGGISIWSAEGDINAGRGAKTSVIYTPPRRLYDDVGNIALAPTVPSNGAGIATLAPIPGVPPGDVDLIAPLGTIDAGEAGIRVSGNVNLAALQVVNAANIQVQGKSTGIPVVAAVNVGALTNASAAAAQATIAAQDVMQRERIAARQALPSIFTVRVLGFGNEPAKDDGGTQSSNRQPRAQIHYDPVNPVQLVGNGRNFNAEQLARLTSDERRRLLQDR